MKKVLLFSICLLILAGCYVRNYQPIPLTRKAAPEDLTGPFWERWREMASKEKEGPGTAGQRSFAGVGVPAAAGASEQGGAEGAVPDGGENEGGDSGENGGESGGGEEGGNGSENGGDNGGGNGGDCKRNRN